MFESRLLRAKRRWLLAAFAVASPVLSPSAHAVNATWNSSPDDANWVTAADDDWNGTAGVYPGSTTGTTNTDLATFLTSATTTVAINQAVNVKSITFGVSGSSPSAFTIGNAGANSGNSLLLSSGGSILLASGVTAATVVQTFNAPIVLEPATATTAGSYTITNSAGAGNSFLFAGNISGGTTTAGVTLNLGPSSTASTISGAISNGGATNGLALTKAASNTGTWILSGANTYSGQTQLLGGTTQVSTINSATGGTALLASSSLGAPTTTANATIVLGVNSSGATLQYVGPGETTNRVISFGGQTSNASMIDASGTGALVFTSNFVVTSTSANAAKGFELTGTSTAANAINGVIADGTGLQITNLTKVGVGTWSLGGPNTYSGSTTLSAGTLIAANATALGAATAPLTIGGGTLDLAVDSSLTAYNTSVGNAATIQSDRATAGAGITQTLGTLSLSGTVLTVTKGANVTSGTATLAFGTVTMNAAAGGASPEFAPTTASVSLGAVTSNNTALKNTLTLDGTSTGNTVTGAISDSGLGGTTGLAKTNTSTWTLSNATGSTYTGGTTINGGTLILSNTSGSATGSGNVTMSSLVSTLASGATGSISGALTTNSKTTSTISPGTAGAIGLLTLGSLNVSGGSAFTFDLGATTAASDQLAITGTLTAPAAVGSGNLAFTFNDLGVVPGTTYTLATFTGSSGLDIGDLTASGISGTFGVNATSITFMVAAVPEPGAATVAVAWILAGLAGRWFLSVRRRRTSR